MENVADALKIAFAVMMFVIALTLSISSFSQATRTVDVITASRDREAQYTYVTPSSNLSRTVGIETVISSMYRAYEENIEIHFYESIGGTEEKMKIYNLIDDDGNIIGDTNCIDLAHKNLKFANKDQATEFLDVLLAGANIDNWDDIKDKYQNRIIHMNGIYKHFTNMNAEFEERLGEYVQGSGTSEMTKRVITYVKK